MPFLSRSQVLLAAAMTFLIVAPKAMAQTSFEAAGGAFSPAVNFSVGMNPFSVAIGDFNGDGKQDLATGNWNSNNISIRLGTGTGSFGGVVNFAAGSGPQTVAVADFNGDGKLDLAVANLLSNDISILVGTGTGAFGAATSFAAGTNPRSVAVADFNGDGKADLVVPNGSSGNISVFLGTGNGGFGLATSFGVGGGAISVAIGDFNADGKQDLAVANEQSNSVSVLLGTGMGTFGTASAVPVGAGPRAVVTGDWNGDGHLDLAVANVDGNNLSILSGMGNGAFSTASTVLAGARPTFVAAGDLSGDGKPELVVANEGGGVSVLLGMGNGSFAPSTDYVAGSSPRCVQLGDFNADGKLDLIVANAGSNDVSLLLREILPVLQVTPSQKANDTSSYALRRTSLWIERQVPSTGLFSHAMYADINKDGFVDFVRTFEANDGVRRPLQVMMGSAGGVFTDKTATVISNAQPGLMVTRKILTGDFNSDGWPDFLLLNHGLDVPEAPGEYPQLFLSNGNGTIRYAGGLEGQQYVAFNHGGGAADVDGNGTLDVLVVNPAQPFLLINDGQGHLTRNTNRLPSEIAGKLMYTGELADIDQDGFIDILVGGGEDAQLGTVIYWGSQSGYYHSYNKTVLPPVAPWGIVLDYAIEDIDRDGRKDLIINRTGSEQVYVGRYFQILRQTAPRVFSDETAARMSMDTTQEWVDYIRVQDINGDGSVDIFLDDKSFVPQGDYAWKNNGAGVFTPYNGAMNPAVPMHSRSDFNADSRSDILWRNQATGGDVIWKSANSATQQAAKAVVLAWKIVGTGDFDGDGRSDIFWRNSSTGANTIWKSANSATLQNVAGVTNQSWRVVGTGQFDGDGKADVLWRNYDTGANTIWKSGNAATLLPMTGVTNMAWDIAGVGDFNNDGLADVLWRNGSTGANTIWNSAKSSPAHAVAGVTTLSWKVAGIGDFNGDGASDIFWHNDATGANVIWKSAQSTTQQAVARMPELAWRVAAIGDYNADGKSDVLWRNDSTGANVIWRDGNSVKPQAVTGVANTAWTITP